MVAQCVKCSPITKVTLVRYLARAICELSCALVWKIKHFRSLAVPRGHNGLIWLAAKGPLACLLLEHVVARSFAIQLLAASRDD